MTGKLFTGHAWDFILFACGVLYKTMIWNQSCVTHVTFLYMLNWKYLEKKLAHSFTVMEIALKHMLVFVLLYLFFSIYFVCLSFPCRRQSPETAEEASTEKMAHCKHRSVPGMRV